LAPAKEMPFTMPNVKSLRGKPNPISFTHQDTPS
jgi:hypothetical protein